MTQSTDNEIKYIRDLLVEIKSDLKDLNKKIDNKIDKLDEKIEQKSTTLDDKLSRVAENVSDIKTDVALLKSNQDNMKEQLSKIDGTQKAQIWSLITLVLATIGTLAIALFKMK